MKSLRSVRYALLLSIVTVLVSLAFAAGTLQAAPLSAHGGTGQALALRASLRSLMPVVKQPKTFKQMSGDEDLRRASDGRYIYKHQVMRGGAMLKDRASAAGAPQVDEAVQTYDVFNPPPTFTPTQGPNLTPTNLTPIWSADETMLVFSSNRTASGGVQADGRFHIWGIPVNGGAPIQFTSSTGPVGGGEFFPALSADSNREMAFTSDANTGGLNPNNVQNLYSMQVTNVTVAVDSSKSPTIRTNDPLAIAQGGLGFSGVLRPTFAPGNSDEIIFSAVSTTGTYGRACSSLLPVCRHRRLRSNHRVAAGEDHRRPRR